MRESTRREWGAIQRNVAWSMITVVASLAWVVAAVAAPVSLAQLQASGAAPLRAVALAGGSGLLLGSAGHGQGAALSWWFPVESPDGPNAEGHAHTLADDVTEWGVAIDEVRGVALVHWLGSSRTLGWLEIEADGALGASGTVDVGALPGRQRPVNVQAVPLAEGWLIASPASAARGQAASAFEVRRLGAASAEPLLVDGQLIDFVGRAGRAWALRWDEGSGALELGVLEPSGQPMQPVSVERWTRLDTVARLGDWEVIINPIDEPFVRAADPRSVIVPIDRPIDLGDASPAIINPIEEPEGLRSGGPRLALLPAGGVWEGLAAWRRNDGAGRLALFDSAAQAQVQALHGVFGDDSRLHLASDGRWLAWQAVDATGLDPVLLADLGEVGLENVTELDAGLLVAAWEAEELVHLLTAQPAESGGDAPALGAFPIKPPNEPPGPTGRARAFGLPSTPAMPIAFDAADQVLDGEWRFVLHRFSQKPILPIEFE